MKLFTACLSMLILMIIVITGCKKDAPGITNHIDNENTNNHPDTIIIDTCASTNIMMIANCDSALWIIDSITADNPLLNPLLSGYKGLENWLYIDSTWRDGNGRAGRWWLDSTETKIFYDYTSGLLIEGSILSLNDSVFITSLDFNGIPAKTYMTKAW